MPTMNIEDPELLTLFDRIHAGSRGASDELYREAFADLYGLARQKMKAQPPGHTLQATALVSEVYLKVDGAMKDVGNRSHFVQLAARAMRQILVDHARRKRSSKRLPPEGVVQVDSPDLIPSSADEPSYEIAALDDALRKLETQDPQLAQLVELHTFGGLTLRECASTLGTPLRTTERWWQVARGTLRMNLEGGEPL